MDTPEFEEWNDELADEVSADGIESLVVYSRDWTIETILSQISQRNIDLNPQFQRRNAWNDIKRSKLIESLIMNVPVPEIVLAEDQSKKKSFIVIDGKQRLLAIAGFFIPDDYPSWDIPKLRNLKARTDLNNLTAEDLNRDSSKFEIVRNLMNSDMRCTVLTNYNNDDVLYDIFYRLNTASTPLSSQELRQVLNRGHFANFLISATNKFIPLHAVMNLEGPDQRLRDAEIILRFICVSLFGSDYSGSLGNFLDQKMKKINDEWSNIELEVERIFQEFNDATSALISCLGARYVGRKFKKGKWENRFNRVLFEAQVYYASRMPDGIMQSRAEYFKNTFKRISSENLLFNDSIETTTKTNEKYHIRFEIIRDLFNSVFGTNVEEIPIKRRD